LNNVVTEYCRGCYYLGRAYRAAADKDVSARVQWCDYRDLSGTARGCPAGDGCVCRDVSRSRRRGARFAVAHGALRTAAR
jgi:hypothetical protein